MKSKRKKFKDPDLDLVPIMNLVTILIPFLIMAAEFIQLAVIDSSAPPIGKPPPDSDDVEEPFQLIVMIMDNGLYIKGSPPVMQQVYGDAAGAGGDDDQELEPTFRCTDGQAELDKCESKDHYDWQSLADTLVDIKEENSSGETLVEDIIIMPDHEIRYEIIVRAMDVVRDGAGLVDLNSSWKKLPEPGDTNYRADKAPIVLFPKVVIGGGKIDND
jgi:biopolymer transport protein ExbD